MSTLPKKSMESSLLSAEAEKIVSMMSVIISAIVRSPGNVSVSAIENDSSVVISVDVAAEDVGKILGKQGRTARSLRTILGAATTHTGRTFNLDIPDSRPFSGA